MKLRNTNGFSLILGIAYGISGAITVGFAQDSTAIDLEKRGRKALQELAGQSGFDVASAKIKY